MLGALSNLGDAFVRVVRIGAATIEQQGAIGFGFGGCSEVARGESRLDPFGGDLLRLFDEGFNHVLFLHDADDLALDEEVTALLTGRDTEVGVRGLRPVR